MIEQIAALLGLFGVAALIVILAFWIIRHWSRVILAFWISRQRSRDKN